MQKAATASLCSNRGYEQKKTPGISGIGEAYMLQGGKSPSNTDPFAQMPPAGADWFSPLWSVEPKAEPLNGSARMQMNPKAESVAMSLDLKKRG
ncbi:MAG: hypothetical protein ACRENP_14080 [Longimicrobiales bacterium]